MNKRWMAGLLAIGLLLAGCTPSTPPPADTELRGVWLSYLELRPLLADTDPTTAAGRLDQVMDACVAAGLNTVFFHVRSHGDAYYPSTVYPAATAAEGLLRQGFDPLAYAVEAAHRRELTLHAWVNPYRLQEDAATGFVKGGVRYADPGDETARRQVLDGVEELLARYEVDGIHFDDYFYPAGMAAEGEPFETIPEGTDVTLWRQTQVDTLISRVYRLCRRYDRLFGVSPAGNLAANRTTAYANVALWMAQPGYIDYICPQLYTGFDHSTRPFTATLEEWTALPRREGVALYVGLALYKAGLADDPYAGTGAAEWSAHSDIIARQVTALRQSADGFVLFRYAYLTDPAATDEMKHLTDILS